MTYGAMIRNMREFVKKEEKAILLGLLIVLSSLFSFGAGYLTARWELKGEVHILEDMR